MALTVLPFTTDAPPQNTWETIQPMLSPALQEACASSPFLTAYMLYLPMDAIGVPDYYAKPPRSLGNAEFTQSDLSDQGRAVRPHLPG